MHELYVLFMILTTCSVVAAVVQTRNGEPWRVWAALGFGMGPLVLAYAVNHRRTSAAFARQQSADPDTPR